MISRSPLSSGHALLWIVLLAFAAVGARNFEPGLSGDGPLYAEIARRVAETGEWFRLDGGVPDFQPYAEHPHLGFWLTSLPFFVLPAADWSARLLGHVCYVVFLWGLFLFVRGRHSESVAVVTVLLLWAWHRFSNPFSNVFVDPPALVFGASSVLCLSAALEGRLVWSALSGVALAACVATKGMLALGFLPALATCLGLALHRRPAAWRGLLARASVLVLAFAVVLGGYVLAVRSSSVPHFFDIYWSRQFTHRFAQLFSLGRLFETRFWPSLLKETYYAAPLVLLSLRGLARKESAIPLFLPLSLLVTFGLMYIGADRIGGQYWLTVMPWVAWLIALGLEPWTRKADRLVLPSAALAVAGVLVVQYVPFEAHGMKPGWDERSVRQLSDKAGVKRLWMDEGTRYLDFIMSCRYAWYGRVTTAYVAKHDPVPSPDTGSAYLLYWSDTPEARRRELQKKGWCLLREFPGEWGRSLWIGCGHPRASPLSPDLVR